MTERESRLLRALAIVRDSEPLLEPQWDGRSREGYVYRGGGSDLDDRSLSSDLAELAKQDYLEAVFVERISLCPNCGSHAVNVFEACLTCSSSNLFTVKTILHFRCGYVGPVEAFRLEPGGRRCPKCEKLLQDLGTDHDSPGDYFTCRVCNSEFQTPEVGARCLGCGSRFIGVEIQRIVPHDVSAYRLTRLGRAALAENRLPDEAPAGPQPADGMLYQRHALLESVEDERRRRRGLGTEFAVLLLAFEPGPRLHDGLDLVPALRGLLLETDKLGRLDGGTFVALLPGASGGRARSTLKSILARSSAVPGGLRAQLVDLPEGGSAADLLDRSARALAPTGPAGRV